MGYQQSLCRTSTAPSGSAGSPSNASAASTIGQPRAWLLEAEATAPPDCRPPVPRWFLVAEQEGMRSVKWYALCTFLLDFDF